MSPLFYAVSASGSFLRPEQDGYYYLLWLYLINTYCSLNKGLIGSY